ncbi:hypothetical protein GBL_2622 [Geobacillus kaustophilus GBlys]|uniref:Uncharacterized protein n=1 Tax=Geobacillus kaustophilus GBlys TaxID=1337888 RepID=U2X666_GEOKU|nr:hypothetical protein GBL_2622 [Geobacillus kaustophilus GBlys]
MSDTAIIVDNKRNCFSGSVIFWANSTASIARSEQSTVLFIKGKKIRFNSSRSVSSSLFSILVFSCFHYLIPVIVFHKDSLCLVFDRTVVFGSRSIVDVRTINHHSMNGFFIFFICTYIIL